MFVTYDTVGLIVGLLALEKLQRFKIHCKADWSYFLLSRLAFQTELVDRMLLLEAKKPPQRGNKPESIPTAARTQTSNSFRLPHSHSSEQSTYKGLVAFSCRLQ